MNRKKSPPLSTWITPPVALLYFVYLHEAIWLFFADFCTNSQATVSDLNVYSYINSNPVSDGGRYITAMDLVATEAFLARLTPAKRETMCIGDIDTVEKRFQQLPGFYVAHCTLNDLAQWVSIAAYPSKD